MAGSWVWNPGDRQARPTSCMISPALSLPVRGPEGRALKAPEECTLLERSRRRGRWREAGISGESGSFLTTILGACECLELGESAVGRATQMQIRHVRVRRALGLPVRSFAVGRDWRAVVARGPGGLAAGGVSAGGRNRGVSGAGDSLLGGRRRMRRSERRGSYGGGHGGVWTRSATASRKVVGAQGGSNGVSERQARQAAATVRIGRAGSGWSGERVAEGWVRAGQGGEEAAGLSGRALATIIWIGTDARARAMGQGCWLGTGAC